MSNRGRNRTSASASASASRLAFNMCDIHWNVIEKIMGAETNFIAKHHIQTYNYFMKTQIYQIFRDNNPVVYYKDRIPKVGEYRFQCKLYMGGKDGQRVYFGKPIIYDEDYQHYMHPNEARLRDMTYGVNVHYDIDIECSIVGLDGQKTDKELTIPLVYLGKIPIMLRSDLCVLNGLTSMARFYLGECRNDPGGYFIIDGMEKILISQEKFANNVINVSENSGDHPYSHTCKIRSISEDPSKPRYPLEMRLMRPDSKYSNNHIVVEVPMIKKSVPFFILMRALGVTSDKAIIEHCLLHLEENQHLLDAFAPSVHDAGNIYTQTTAIQYIQYFTHFKNPNQVIQILSDYLLPHMGTMNFKAKAYFLGHMAYRLVRVQAGIDEPTIRDSFKYKRVQSPGNLLYTLFSEYYIMQIKAMKTEIDREFTYNRERHGPEWPPDLESLATVFEQNYSNLFSNLIVHEGIEKGFKGNWGSKMHTKIDGVAQGLDRRSFNSLISQMRKTNIDLDSTSKVIAPRLLHTSQWGFICPLDTPDGGNIGLHKNLATGAILSPHISVFSVLEWLSQNSHLILLHDCHPKELYHYMKAFVNGVFVGVIRSNIVKLVRRIRIYRRAGVIPIYISYDIEYSRREFYINADEGRIMRYIYHVNSDEDRPTFRRNPIFLKQIHSRKFSVQDLISGLENKNIDGFNYEHTQFYQPDEIYRMQTAATSAATTTAAAASKDKGKGKGKDRSTRASLSSSAPVASTSAASGGTIIDYGDLDPLTPEEQWLDAHGGIVELLDNGETEQCYIAMNEVDIEENSKHTHLEIHPSLIVSVLANQTNYADHNYTVRDSYSPGQIRQTMSMFHTNFMNRMDTGYLLHYGQKPLATTKYYDYFTNNEHPYGENIIVAIMTYTGFNVEDSIIFNASSVERGMLNITYFHAEKAEEYIAGTAADNSGGSKKKKKTQNEIYFRNVLEYQVDRLKPGYDYSKLDNNGIIRENTRIDDKMVLVGRVRPDPFRPGMFADESITTHKEQSGYIDKVFMAAKENGARMVKLRVRQNRQPTIGDKFVSRCAQKGTISCLLKEDDMPFTAEGLRPDIIINPHCMPSRMTVGQLIEAITSKTCLYYGCHTDCTAFNGAPNKHEQMGNLLRKLDTPMHSRGHETLYDGFTGEQIEAEIFMAPTYYMRLKQMTQDKINYRARGPREALTRQTVQGRAQDGGLRIGEMERDCIISHGMSNFLNESMMVRGDEYTMTVCNKTGSIAAYNPHKSMYYSPSLDGPLKFQYDTNQINVVNEHISDNHHSFSQVRIPYCFKLLMQELAVMNVNMRIITEDNIDQIPSLTFSEEYIKGHAPNSDQAERVNKDEKQEKEENSPNDGKIKGKYDDDDDDDAFTPDKLPALDFEDLTSDQGSESESNQTSATPETNAEIDPEVKREPETDADPNDGIQEVTDTLKVGDGDSDADVEGSVPIKLVPIDKSDDNDDDDEADSDGESDDSSDEETSASSSSTTKGGKTLRSNVPGWIAKRMKGGGIMWLSALDPNTTSLVEPTAEPPNWNTSAIKDLATDTRSPIGEANDAVMDTLKEMGDANGIEDPTRFLQAAINTHYNAQVGSGAVAAKNALKPPKNK